MTNIILIVIVTTLIVTIFGSNIGDYILAQEGAITPEGSINDTMSGKNATQWANATLAFAQEGAITPEGSINDTMSGKNATQWANATLAVSIVS
jgi:hypothetical protein